MNKTKKIVSCIAALGVCMGIGVTASAFSDMPSGEAGEALEKAVEAGLMNGVTDDTIEPDSPITRAQMAAIITRAFGATALSDTSFNDVSDQWYAEYVSRAAAMGAFEGDDDNNFNPENYISFQETYAVLSRMFGFEPYEVNAGKANAYLLGDVDDTVLDAFSDSSELADWAKNYAKYIVGNGGWTGIDGLLKPTANVTRAEFAILMNDLVAEYVDAPGTYTDLPDGLIMVRSGGVTIDGLKLSKGHNLIITYGVDESGCTVTNSTVMGVTLILGGADTTPVESTSKPGELTPDEINVKIAGTFYDVRVSAPYVFLDANSAKMSYFKGCENSKVSLSLQ